MKIIPETITVLTALSDAVIETGEEVEGNDGRAFVPTTLHVEWTRQLDSPEWELAEVVLHGPGGWLEIDGMDTDYEKPEWLERALSVLKKRLPSIHVRVEREESKSAIYARAMGATGAVYTEEHILNGGSRLTIHEDRAMHA
ncbi:Hypothetical protein AJAP_27995 [Amycolatopsis japonica]|uniref:Uncharacterized protein n=1 Tax=Amycolatopsis japonica TaxID=208439 RepID=A0A075UZN2_9PSEU|nr:hypothetical protein [Amycolatopsis japonica]AIG78438.1 Hypothetical protein AJAP_27995 [Amycolatopsis japonica]